MADADSVSRGLAALGASGWTVGEAFTGVTRALRVITPTQITISEAGQYYLSGVGGGAGGGNGEAIAAGGGGGGGGSGRARVRVPVSLRAGDVVVMTPGAGGAIGANGSASTVAVNGRVVWSAANGLAGGAGAAGVGGVGGGIGGSFQGVSNVAAGANSNVRSTSYPDVYTGGCCSGSGGGSTALAAGIGQLHCSDSFIASTGNSGGGHGGDNVFTAHANGATRGGVGGAPSASATACAADAWGCGGGGGGAGAVPGSGSAGQQGVIYLEWPAEGG